MVCTNENVVARWIVLDWKIKLVPVPSTVTVFTLTKTSEQNATKLIHQWQYVAPNLPQDLSILLTISGDGNGSIQATLIGPVEILLDRNASVKSYFKVKSDYVNQPIPEFVFKEMGRWFEDEEGRNATISFVPYGGRMDEIPESETPFPHRAGNLYIIRDLDIGVNDEDKTSYDQASTWGFKY
ncbi:hypothetical protein F3Y22_tig00110569pilonHSYRG00017 [Hibiscus syriacus]|uniref:Uncharacterized protein n=1 Tax=Hibiscus syriacus TaxID=106335 RepID=A0A6A3A7P2_HIBSY|nr:hypothetical protein F3Y22_tig00110569pilonHSYRG00017 [Hibiscus syriacus]